MSYVKDRDRYTRGVRAIAAVDSRDPRRALAARKASAVATHKRDVAMAALGAINEGGFSAYRDNHVLTNLESINVIGSGSSTLPIGKTPPRGPVQPGLTIRNPALAGNLLKKVFPQRVLPGVIVAPHVPMPTSSGGGVTGTDGAGTPSYGGGGGGGAADASSADGTVIPPVPDTGTIPTEDSIGGFDKKKLLIAGAVIGGLYLLLRGGS